MLVQGAKVGLNAKRLKARRLPSDDFEPSVAPARTSQTPQGSDPSLRFPVSNAMLTRMRTASVLLDEIEVESNFVVRVCVAQGTDAACMWHE